MVSFRIAAAGKIEASRHLTPVAYRIHIVSAIQGSLPSSQRRRSVLGRRNLRPSPRLSFVCYAYTSLAGEKAAPASLRSMSETVAKDNVTMYQCLIVDLEKRITNRRSKRTRSTLSTCYFSTIINLRALLGKFSHGQRPISILFKLCSGFRAPLSTSLFFTNVARNVNRAT